MNKRKALVHIKSLMKARGLETPLSVVRLSVVRIFETTGCVS